MIKEIVNRLAAIKGVGQTLIYRIDNYKPFSHVNEQELALKGMLDEINIARRLVEEMLTELDNE